MRTLFDQRLVAIEDKGEAGTDINANPLPSPSFSWTFFYCTRKLEENRIKISFLILTYVYLVLSSLTTDRDKARLTQSLNLKCSTMYEPFYYLCFQLFLRFMSM